MLENNPYLAPEYITPRGGLPPLAELKRQHEQAQRKEWVAMLRSIWYHGLFWVAFATWGFYAGYRRGVSLGTQYTVHATAEAWQADTERRRAEADSVEELNTVHLWHRMEADTITPLSQQWNSQQKK